MKTYKFYVFVLITGCLAINTFAQNKQAKTNAKTAEIRALIENQNFNFTAQYANPQGGGHKYLTSDYSLTIKKDSLIAYLPYFGRGYFDIPYNPTDDGIKFTSTKFSYKVTEKRKGGWDVIIVPSDVKYYSRINIYVSQSGSANADFTITNRSFISFDGYVEANKAPKKQQP